MRERAPEARAAHAVRSLEEVTLEPHGSTALPDLLPEGDFACADGQASIKVTRYQDGLRVVVFQRKGRAARGGGAASLADSASEKSSASSSGQRLDASLNRSRALVAHRARCLGPVALWTFTKRGKFDSADHVWRVWRAFSQLMRRRYGEKFRFVAVPELHADGETWHLHVLFDRVFMVESLRTLWTRALGGTGRERGQEAHDGIRARGLISP